MRPQRAQEDRRSVATRLFTRHLFTTGAALFSTALLAGCPGDSTSAEDGGSFVGCIQDLSLGPDSAESLGATAEGYLCPSVDEDWYSFTVPEGDTLLNLQLTIDNARSPVEATYVISTADAPETAVVASLGSDVQPGAAYDDTHCVEPGNYLVVVRDENQDAEDIRNPYALQIQTEPDPDSLEPNESSTEATVVSMSTPTSGYISCIGDVDYFEFQVPEQKSVTLTLTSGAPLGYEPRVTLEQSDGTAILEDSDPRGTLEATSITLERQLSPGTYRVRVEDSGNDGANSTVAYVLTFGLFEDPDVNEPNDRPANATSLGTLSCAGAWSEYRLASGALVTAADNDWYVVNLDGCEGDVIEVEAMLDTSSLSDAAAWEMQDQVQIAVGIVRDVPGSACNEDDDCIVLSNICSSNLDCAGLGESCQSDGRCAGTRACLPSGVCSARQTFRAYQEQAVPDPIQGRPPENQVRMAAPILSSGAVWILVSDFQSNGGAPNALYNLRVRVQTEPDGHEPDNRYTSSPATIAALDPIETEFTVHDCTEGDCCSSDKMVSAHISYDGDQDFFAGTHPCSGVGCMLRLHYESDSGDVPAALRLRTSAGPWYDALVEPGTSGTIGDEGRPVGERQCIVADRSHSERPFEMLFYYFNLADPSETGWDADQTVRFCLEVTSYECESPCVPSGEDCLLAP